MMKAMMKMVDNGLTCHGLKLELELDLLLVFFGVCGNLAIYTTWRNTYFQFMHGLADWLYVMITVKCTALRRKLAWE